MAPVSEQIFFGGEINKCFPQARVSFPFFPLCALTFFLYLALLAAGASEHAIITHRRTLTTQCLARAGAQLCEFYTWMANGKIRLTYKHFCSCV